MSIGKLDRRSLLTLDEGARRAMEEAGRIGYCPRCDREFLKRTPWLRGRCPACGHRIDLTEPLAPPAAAAAPAGDKDPVEREIESLFAAERNRLGLRTVDQPANWNTDSSVGPLAPGYSAPVPQVGDLLQSLRRRLGMSQDLMARALAVSRVTLWRIEKGRHVPYRPFLKRAMAMAEDNGFGQIAGQLREHVRHIRYFRQRGDKAGGV